MRSLLSYEPLVKALKEGARVVLLSVVPLLINALNEGSVDWRFIGIAAIVAALRFLDKILHEIGKDTDNDRLKMGLTRF